MAFAIIGLFSLPTLASLFFACAYLKKRDVISPLQLAVQLELVGISWYCLWVGGDPIMFGLAVISWLIVSILSLILVILVLRRIVKH